ncbi:MULTISPECIES: hypothetical protein [Halomonas]|nr:MULTISPECIES: hypothetical protein [Halomonas]
MMIWPSLVIINAEIVALADVARQALDEQAQQQPFIEESRP